MGDFLHNNSLDGDHVPPSFFDSNTSFANNDSNVGDTEEGEEFLVMIVISVLLGLIILATVVGNVFVLAAIWMERNLHSVANYLILSLAVADLMVACLVMPLGAVYQVSKKWMLGPTLCDMWTSSDVLSCTASILHLVAIAMDRYWAVTNIDYIHQRNPRRILTMIAVIWGLSLLISLVQLGWKDEDWQNRIENNECTVSQELGYQIFGTLSSFYVPLTVILLLYWKIWKTARNRIRKRRPPPATALLPRPAAETSLITTATASSSNPSPEKTVLINNGGGGGSGGCSKQLVPPGSPNLSTSTTGVTPEATPIRKHKSSRESGESKRERKAAKTLAIITGAFIMCWLPFFVMALAMPLCHPGCPISLDSTVFAVFLWLGYFNSTLNPIIYTIFSPEFRLAFKKILFGKQHRKSRAVAV